MSHHPVDEEQGRWYFQAMRRLAPSRLVLLAVALVLIISASLGVVAGVVANSLDTGFSVGTGVLAILALLQQFVAVPAVRGLKWQIEE
jgi:membrane protein YdbS with pleckstrin-like domain